MLGAGSAWAQKDQLTWDIDPALLSDVSVMTQQYFTGGNDVCSERFEEPASTAAGQWLAQLKTSTAGGSAFLSPYANVDVAALSHSGLDSSIQSAYLLGESVAGEILPDTFGDKGTGTSDGAVLKAAWPADGLADAGVLTSLASDGGVNTVVLSSGELSPSVGGGEDALAKTVNSVGNGMSLLVANSRITSLLGTAAAAKTAASQFALTQDFLAQTAMIAAEADTARSLVVAPPTGWNPSSGVANTLLSITRQAPWLHVTGLSALATQAAQLPSTTQVPAKQVSPAELSDTYLDSVAKAATGVSLFKDLLYQPPARQVDQLDGAVATLQSSAWRGSGSYGGSFVTAQLAWLPVVPRAQGADDRQQEAPACRAVGGDPRVRAERPGPADPGSGAGHHPARKPDHRGLGRDAEGTRGRNGHVQDVRALVYHRHDHRAATVGDAGRVAAELDRAAAERRGDAVRTVATYHYRRRARYPRADVGLPVAPQAARWRQEPWQC